jgi:hypothetical protein
VDPDAPTDLDLKIQIFNRRQQIAKNMMIFTLIVSLVTIFFDLVLRGDFNDLFVRLILGLCLTLFIITYSLWRVYLSTMATYLS